MTDARRPRDLALLLLAAEHEPPRARARDQKADLLGMEIRREVLRRLVALDPEPDESSLAESIDRVICESPETGSARASCLMFLEEWRQALANPGLWEYFLAAAIEETNKA